ncbi:MAG TPA: hypothetical protein DIU35_05850, partial [Candidatus Latescibacteria bacterium]|nr:hypothetical protein [Candidatus Latescibacterota bacterium]
RGEISRPPLSSEECSEGHFSQPEHGDMAMAENKARSNPLAELRTAITQASPEERRELAKELGLGQRVGAPKPRPRRAETNETVRELSRISGGASSVVTKGPAPAPWIVEVGGGANLDKEGNELPAEAAWKDNWAVEMLRDRWLAGKPPLPNAEAYLRERQSQGHYETTIDAQGHAQVEGLAAEALNASTN